MCDQQSLSSACAFAQSDQSLCLSLGYSMFFKLLTEHRLEFLSYKGGCIGSSESTLVKLLEISCRGSNLISCGTQYHKFVLITDIVDHVNINIIDTVL